MAVNEALQVRNDSNLKRQKLARICYFLNIQIFRK